MLYLSQFNYFKIIQIHVAMTFDLKDAYPHETYSVFDVYERNFIGFFHKKYF